MSDTITLSKRDHAVLTAVAALGETGYGNTILKEVNKGRTWWQQISFGGLYISLSRLESAGLINSRWGEATPERGWRRKRHYWLTEAGNKASQQKKARCEDASQEAYDDAALHILHDIFSGLSRLEPSQKLERIAAWRTWLKSQESKKVQAAYTRWLNYYEKKAKDELAVDLVLRDFPRLES